MKFGRWILLLAGLTAARPAWSQVSVYGDFSAAQVSTNAGTVYLYGPTVGVGTALATWHSLGIGADMRGSFLYGSGQSYDGLAVGPQISKKIKKFTPHGEFMVGFARYNPNNPAIPISTDFQLEGNGGLDRRMSKRIDWRIVDFSYTQYYELHDRIHPYLFSTGLVLHLGSQ